MLLAHRVDERAAELAVARARAQRPAERVDHPPQRPRHLPDLLHAERPRLRARPGEAEVPERRAGEMPGRALGEDRHARADVRARARSARSSSPVAAAPLVAGAHADDRAVLDEQLRRRGLRQHHRAEPLGPLGERAPELRERDDDVALVPHRRRRRDAHRAVAASGSRRPRRAPRRTTGSRRRRAAAAAAPGRAPRPRAGASPGALPFSSTATGTSPSCAAVSASAAASWPSRIAAASPAGPGADDEHADLDRIRVRGLGDRLGVAPRRRDSRRASRALRRSRTSRVSSGTISFRSPTTPRSAYSKIGACGSLLIATIVPEPCMPTLCWIAPEMPTAT